MSFKKILLGVSVLVLLAAPAYADFAAGKKAYDAKDWKGAILELRPLTETGDAAAALLLGNMYLQGYGVEKDPEEAFQLYRRSALGNNIEGMLSVATLYQSGNGTPADTQFAIDWFSRAARAGSQYGAFFYAIHLYQGAKGDTYDIKPDKPAAYKWFRIAGHGTNTKLSEQAFAFADNLAKDLKPEEVAAAAEASQGWKAEDVTALGPPLDSLPVPAPAPAPKVVPPAMEEKKKP